MTRGEITFLAVAGAIAFVFVVLLWLEHRAAARRRKHGREL